MCKESTESTPRFMDWPSMAEEWKNGILERVEGSATWLSEIQEGDT